MRLAIYFFILILFSCSTKENNQSIAAVYRHYGSEEFAEWSYSHSDTLLNRPTIKAKAETLNFDLLDSLSLYNEKFYKYHYISPSLVDVEGIVLTDAKGKFILTWNLSFLALYDHEPNERIVVDLLHSSRWFNFDYIPPPPPPMIDGKK